LAVRRRLAAENLKRESCGLPETSSNCWLLELEIQNLPDPLAPSEHRICHFGAQNIKWASTGLAQRCNGIETWANIFFCISSWHCAAPIKLGDADRRNIIVGLTGAQLTIYLTLEIIFGMRL
jgi:hypothetical protein